MIYDVLQRLVSYTNKQNQEEHVQEKCRRSKVIGILYVWRMKKKKFRLDSSLSTFTFDQFITSIKIDFVIILDLLDSRIINYRFLKTRDSDCHDFYILVY